MGAGPRTRVEATPAAAPRISLFQAATVIDDNGRWQSGFEYAPETCIAGGGFNPCDPATSLDDIQANEPIVVVEPVGIWVGEKCSTLGADGRELEARVRRLLIARQPVLVEHELWTGALAQSYVDDGFDQYDDNPRLTGVASDVVTQGATSVVRAIACLESGLADCGVDQGVIHVPAHVATFMVAAQLVRREGRLLLTNARDTIVVPGGGYDGSGPDGQAAAVDSTWVYATGPVTVRLGVIDNQTVNAETVDRDINDAEVRALRLAAVSFDPCCHFAAETEIDPCGLGGAGS